MSATTTVTGKAICVDTVEGERFFVESQLDDEWNTWSAVLNLSALQCSTTDAAMQEVARKARRFADAVLGEGRS